MGSLSATVTTRRRRPVRLAAALAGLAAIPALGGCSDADDGSETVRVFAAASLADVLAEIGDGFTARTGIEVELNVAGSSTLRLQLDEGARADVFVPADATQLDRLEVGIDGSPTTVATNELVVAFPAGAAPVTLADFDDEDLLLGACAPQVPCGNYAALAWDAIGIEPALDTEEGDVRAVAAKVAEGELDAGLVYATDVRLDDRLESTPLPAAAREVVAVSYPAARLADAPNADGARRFVDHLLGEDAREVFARYGFGAP